MAETQKSIRLSKAIKEFNLSLDHIVDFLKNEGFSIESNPNAKLPGDAYALLLKEFQSDKTAKEEAQQLTQAKLKKEQSVVLEADESKKPVAKKEEEGNEILIKNISVADMLKEEKPKKKAAAKSETKEIVKEVIKAKAEKVDGPKLVGKIEIEESPAKG
jgi:translation initiation factor IF-2